ncbi:unnamed protein product [Ectocarpus sp. 13 AM-2016]
MMLLPWFPSDASVTGRVADLAAILLLLAVVPATGNIGDPYSIEEIFKRQRTHAKDLQPNDLSVWGNTWQMVLHNQIDGLFSSLDERAANDGLLVEGASEVAPEFKIAIIGDSTMQMQATFLRWMLLERTSEGGSSQCLPAANHEWGGEDGKELQQFLLRCKAASTAVNVDRNSSRTDGIVMSLQYIKVSDGTYAEAVDADIVYFGSGLHILQLIPHRSLSKPKIETWANYERMLEEAIVHYRTGHVNMRRRVPIEVIFMTTHSITEQALDSSYAIGVKGCGKPTSNMLAQCHRYVDGLRKTNDVRRVQLDQPTERKLNAICVHGCFNDDGVVDLNRRAEAVMFELDVPVVAGYDITHGQSWATATRDGRHYPTMVPLEIVSFLSHITTALRREQRWKRTTNETPV